MVEKTIEIKFLKSMVLAMIISAFFATHMEEKVVRTALKKVISTNPIQPKGVIIK
ncbi:MAG TPA: hypothetical protein VIJ95_06140 [Hanamia sp.]